MSSLFYEIKKNEFRNEKYFNSATTDRISKINPKKLIDEALLIGKKISYKNKKNDIREDLLEEMRTKILQAYLESVKEKTIKEIKTELNFKIEEYIKNIQVLLIKSNCEKETYKKQSERIEVENNNIKQINSSLIKYNNELIKEINNYQSNLASLQKSYDLLYKQKDLFEIILREYSGDTPNKILSELKLAKEGSIQLLEKLDDLMRENAEMKKEIENIEKKYEIKIESIIKESNNYKEDAINTEKEQNFKIKYLENQLYNNDKYQKENYNLHQILYYIYNLLFQEFSLNKDIKINTKFLDIKESDFEPNVLYDVEIRNYIELMIKSMHRENIDSLFREIMGYLNMIIRKYFPNKNNLRFKPIEILKEINNFIDKKIKTINQNKTLIDEYKNNYNKLQKENIKINKKLSHDNNNNYNYDSFFHLNSVNTLNKNYKENKDKDKDKDINQLKNNLNNRNNYNDQIFLSKTINTKFNNNNKKKRINTVSIDNKKSINNNNNISLFRIRKNKLKNENNKTREENIIKNSKIFEHRKGLNTLSLFDKQLTTDGDINNDKLFYKINNEIRNKSSKIIKNKTITIEPNNDKIIKTNGNNKHIKIYHDINFIIDETNRMFLYKPRMNSYNERINLNLNKSLEKNKESKNIKMYNILKIRNMKNKYYYNELEKKICGEINNLIKNIKK